MQLEVSGIILRSFQFIKDVVVEPFDQIDTFRWREEIFRHDVAELAIRNVLDMVGRDIGNLSEGKVPCQCLLFAVKESALSFSNSTCFLF